MSAERSTYKELQQMIYDGLLKGDDGDSAPFIALSKLVEQLDHLRAIEDAAWRVAALYSHPHFTAAQNEELYSRAAALRNALNTQTDRPNPELPMRPALRGIQPLMEDK